MSTLKPRPGRNLWPLGIIFAFVLFVGGTVGLIVMASLHSEELVSADYYAQELRYQQQMERQDRARALPEPARIAYDAATQTITITLPPLQASQHPTGTIQLYRPSAAGQDRKLELKLDAAGRQILSVRELSPGLWRVRVNWTCEGQDYAAEQKVVLKRDAS